MNQNVQIDCFSDRAILPIRAFGDNYIWVGVDFHLREAWVVDPGDETPVTQFLSQHQLQLVGILLTHHHRDHSGGIAALLDKWPGMPVYGAINSSVPYVTHRVKEGDRITCSSVQLDVLNIPGHTLDHIAFYNKALLFCGDTLFSAGCGKVFEGTYEQMYNSINKLMMLSDQVNVYCGHEYTLHNLLFAERVEPHNTDITQKIVEVKKAIASGGASLPSILHEEKKYNPFLRCAEPSVIAAVEQYAKANLSSPHAVFKCLRRWKDEAGS